MSQPIDKERALSFKRVAKLYDTVRPGYPSSWIQDIQKITGINNESNILEIGSGTGIATTDLLTVTERITCLDPGSEMLTIAKSKFPDLTFVTSTFEQFNSPGGYDLVLAAMAWHWVDPKIGYQKAHDLLVNGGHLATIHYYHIDSDLNSFHNRAQDIYEKYSSASTSKRHIEQLNRIEADSKAFNNRYFSLVKKIMYNWQEEYTIQEYLALRNSYSDHLTMDPDSRKKMEGELTSFAMKEFDGRLTKKYTTVLLIAQRNNLG